MDIIKCPLCGGTDIREGELEKYKELISSNIIFPKLVPVIVNVCTECGYILRMRVVELSKV
ncbi:transcription initiation factor TFIIIB [Clostridium perfringens]|nr:transcription initiation factor TFIIIB [Clostridium perfringens]